MSSVVAQLVRNEVLVGTAWLISEDFALTALHCVDELLDDDKLIMEFYGGLRISVVIQESLSGLDIAILRLEGNKPEIPWQIYVLSSQDIRLDDRVYTIGHAHIAAASYPQGTKFMGRVRSTTLALNSNESLTKDPIFAQIAEIDPPPGSVSNIKGLSGAPVILSNRPDNVIGVVIESGLAGGLIDIVPVIEIAKRSEIVANLLSKPILAIELDEQGHILWSAGFDPSHIAEVWSGEGASKSVSVASAIKDLGEVSDAILRFIAHADIRDCRVTNADIWTTRLHRDFATAKVYFIERKYGNRHEPFELSVPFITYEPEILAEKLHTAMDNWLLNQLNEEILSYLVNEKKIMGGEIHCQLREKMQVTWDCWMNQLTSASDLLRCLLVRLASHNDTARTSGNELIRIGRLTSLDELSHPILFALALAAAGIGITPAKLVEGNVEMSDSSSSSATQSGHACGSKTVGGKTWARAADTHSWTVRFVILPALQEPYLPLVKWSIPINRVCTGLTLGDPGSPPVVISGDGAYLRAMSCGEIAVREHYEERSREVSDYLNNLSVPARGMV